MAWQGGPPDRDAGWLAILNWACRGALDASKADIDLALKVWSGRTDLVDRPKPPGP